MAKNIEIKMISRETIKPSSPTPNHLKKFNLSLHDLSVPKNSYTSLIFFYHIHDQFNNNNVSDTLKSSLSETLTDFYPLAGRIVDNELYVDCTDEGAEFGEAEVSGGLSDILERPDQELLSGLLPVINMSEQEANYKLLLVQANFFRGCGGDVAIGVSVSRTLADASSIGLLVKRWAGAARGAGDTVVPDLTTIASRFPAVPVHQGIWSQVSKNFNVNYKTTRYVFNSKHITALKAEATSETVQRPSSVEVVSGHIWMNMMRLSSGHTRSSYLSHSMNLRKRMEPPLSENTFGNLVGIVRSRVDEGERVELKRLVGKMRREFERVIECHAREGSFVTPIDIINEFIALAMEGSETCTFSSWCGFGFYENADFGWGRPVWISPGAIRMLVVLMDGRGGDGIEAWLNFPQKTMEVIETNHLNLLQFATLNPSVTF